MLLANTHNPKVTGSSPVPATKEAINESWWLFLCGKAKLACALSKGKVSFCVSGLRASFVKLPLFWSIFEHSEEMNPVPATKEEGLSFQTRTFFY